MTEIQCYFSDFGGCYYYRLAFPFNAIHERMRHKFNVMLTYKLNAPTLRKANLAVFQRVTSPDILLFVRAAKNSNIKVVIDIDDDLLDIPLSNPAFDHWDVKTRGLYTEALTLADALFVSTKTLKDKYSKINPNVAVLPNSIDPFYVRGLKRAHNNEKPVVVYQGSNTHVKDLAEVQKFLNWIIDYKGFVLKSLGQQFPRSLYTMPIPFESFLNVLAALDPDVGLAPLYPHPFNRAKSNIKWMEYAMVDSPTIASNVGPYRCIRPGIDGMLATTLEEWQTALFQLVGNPEFSKAIVKAAKSRIMEHYNIEINYKSWADNLDRIMDGAPVQDHIFTGEEAFANDL